ncbi:MAG: hypothetical protein KDD52_07280 [Bdellovibrionales bacterium]|nr:hypothetical protein [Bdellovibrionales bacterium]
MKNMQEMNQKSKNSFRSLRELFDFSKEDKPRFIRASCFSVLNKVMDIAPEILIGMAIDVVVSKENSFLARFGLQDPWTQIVCLGIMTFFIWVLESLF